MRDKIQAILERELDKLDARSRSLAPEPLPSADIKSLDTLIKAYRSFIDPKSLPDKPAPDDPASLSNEQLLAQVNDDQKQG